MFPHLEFKSQTDLRERQDFHGGHGELSKMDQKKQIAIFLARLAIPVSILYEVGQVFHFQPKPHVTSGTLSLK